GGGGGTEEARRGRVAALGPQHRSLVIAYEPVWAIGTGLTATPQIAQEAHAFIKEIHPTAVLYGGSGKPENAAELLSQPDIDGAPVGGASLDVESFTPIFRAAPPTPLSRSSSSTGGAARRRALATPSSRQTPRSSTGSGPSIRTRRWRRAARRSACRTVRWAIRRSAT